MLESIGNDKFYEGKSFIKRNNRQALKIYIKNTTLGRIPEENAPSVH
jgi:hypothetical protein